LSAGAICAVWPIKAQPMADSDALISEIDRFVLNPGIDSSLSSVPPVCPSPRPDIIGTTPPHAATSGAMTIEVLSPTPPVLCLSTFTPGMSERSTREPEAHHGIGEHRCLLRGHAAQQNGHQQGRGLIVRK
jgi:hypothetical protein